MNSFLMIVHIQAKNQTSFNNITITYNYILTLSKGSVYSKSQPTKA